MLTNPADEHQIDAEGFVRQCRRGRHINEVVRQQVPHIVSKDFISGSAQHWSELAELSPMLFPSAG